MKELWDKYKDFVIIGIFMALLGVSYWLGYGSGKEHVQSKWDAQKVLEQAAIEKDRSARQATADKINEDTMIKLQNAIVDNEKITEELNEERSKDPAYKCRVPSNGISLYNRAIKTDRR